MARSTETAFFKAIAIWVLVILMALCCMLAIVLKRMQVSEQQLDSAFLAGMEAGNQSCSVLVPERERRNPLALSGGLL